MVEIIEWNGTRYRRYPESKHAASRTYFQRSKRGGTSWLHRDVWEHERGPIPDGWHIHHIDGNPENNDISNLECVSPKQHAERHVWDDERKRRQAEHLDKIRDATKSWHASDEGRAKHREIGALAYAAFTPEPKPCEHCGTSFAPRKIGNQDRFCSGKCKSAWRRKSGLDDETRACEICGSAFLANKYSKFRTCSRSCGNSARGRTMRESLRPDG